MRALAAAVDALRQQLEIANRQTEAERSRVDQLVMELADALTAAMITGSEAAALRSRLEILADRRLWWRRWFR